MKTVVVLESCAEDAGGAYAKKRSAVDIPPRFLLIWVWAQAPCPAESGAERQTKAPKARNTDACKASVRNMGAN
jgi:hypothetical protein